MKLKFFTRLFTVLALVFAGTTTFAQFTQKEMVAEWQRAKDYTRSYLDAMPEDGYAFKPTPEIRSFAQQMLHLADANYLFASSASGKPNSPGVTLAKHDVLQTPSAETK